VTREARDDRLRRYFATCAKGLEEVLAAELRSPWIGAADVEPGASGVAFRGSWAVGYRANLWLRTAVRVLVELARGPAPDPDALYRLARSVEWPRWMRLDQTFSVEARVRDSGITHSKYAALRVKDALCDVFRDATKGSRPNVDVAGADLPLFVTIYRNAAVLYRDMSGQTLHKRGYRDAMHKSSLNETVAAGMLLLSGWDGRTPIVDPMCGAGTLVIEAALLALRRAPGLTRLRFPFEEWPDFDRRVWRECREAAAGAALERLPYRIEGNDRHAGAISLAKKDAASAGVARFVRFTRGEVADFAPEAPPSHVFVNPPWGERLADEGVEGSYRQLRDFLKGRCAGSEAWLLSGTRGPTRFLGMKATRRFPIRIGKVDCRILHYDVRGFEPRDRISGS
jgi:putative N6-adenine-specific DNA methylase